MCVLPSMSSWGWRSKKEKMGNIKISFLKCYKLKQKKQNLSLAGAQ